MLQPSDCLAIAELTGLYLWLWIIEKQQPTLQDALGVSIVLIGCVVIIP